jgi:hypothetical protein
VALHQPDPLSEARLQTLLVTRAGMTAEAAEAKVKALKVNEYVDLLTTEKDDEDLPTEFSDGFPPVADGTSTPT